MHGIQVASALTGLSDGIDSLGGKFELDVVAKDAYDKRYATNIHLGSYASIGHDGVGVRRWAGLVFRGRLN
jgi:hypothetical protein